MIPDSECGGVHVLYEKYREYTMAIHQWVSCWPLRT